MAARVSVLANLENSFPSQPKAIIDRMLLAGFDEADAKEVAVQFLLAKQRARLDENNGRSDPPTA